MPGTPAGIAKANAAKARKRAERAAALAATRAQQQSQSVSSATEPNALDVPRIEPAAPAQPMPLAILDAMPDAISLGMSLPVVDPNERTSPRLSLTRQALISIALPSLDVLNRIIQGRIKAPAMVRANSAIRVLEMAGVPVDSKAAPGADQAAGLGRIFEAFAKLAELRARAAGAETVTTVDQGPPAPSQT